jgi:hypothetical protein
MEWNQYALYDPGTRGLLSDLSRRDAKQAFDRLMRAKADRYIQLAQLTEANGVVLGTADPQIQVLNDWFRSEVEADVNSPMRLRPEWYSVVIDLALFLGDVMIERSPSLRWEFFIGGARDASYQRHVIMGFRAVENPKFNIDIDAAVAAYGHRLVAGVDDEPQAFLGWLKYAAERA